MPSDPLTHHEILKLIEPFTRRGYHADLSATCRLERRLVFKPVERHLDFPDGPALQETLSLENPKADFYRLTRRLSYAAGSDVLLEAELEAEGERPADLLAQVEAIAPERQFRFGPHFAMAMSYRLSYIEGAGQAAGLPALSLITMAAQLENLSIGFRAPVVKGDPEGLIELMPTTEGLLCLPEDLLAVLGLEWGLLQPKGKGWKSRLLMRGGEPRRSVKTGLKLERMVNHIAQTLRETPAHYHERMAAARWRVVLRRSIPLILSILLVAGAFATSSLNIAEDSQLRLLVLNAPPVLLVLFFCLREIPSIEIPPFPKRSKASDWRTRQPAPVSGPKALWRGLRARDR